MTRKCVVFQVLINMAVFLVPLTAPAQDVAEAPHSDARVLLRVRPTSSAEQDREALLKMAQLFESEKVDVAAGTKLADLSLGHCGRIDQAWINLLLKTNPSVSGQSTAEPMTIDLPPCPYWGTEKEVKIPAGATMSHMLALNMGNFGTKSLGKVAAANERTVESLDDVKAGERVTLPYTTAYNAYTLKPEYRGNPGLAAEIKQIPGYTDVMPQHDMTLIVAASNSDCVAPTTSEWPFSTERLRKVLEYNNTKRSHPPMMAVIAVADTGLDRNEDRVFLKINDRENPIPNNIDDDENGYIDDIQGANMDRNVPGFPARNDAFLSNEHGTHVSGLALGGLSDDKLNALVKDRIRIEELNLVLKEVLQLGLSRPTTRFSIPNNFLLDAFQYAAAEPSAQIINLSVEDEESSGLEGALAGTSSLVVAAAGNDGINIDQDERYPAAAKNRDKLITVAAYDGSGGLARFSNWGPNDVDLAAPGCQIDSILPGNNRGKLNGTSQAAPLVAFTAALLYSEGLTIAQIKSRILLTTEIDHANLGTCTGTGHCVASEGRLDIVKALNVHEDVLIIQKADGTKTVLTGFAKNCIQLDLGCYFPGTDLKRLVHVPKTTDGRVWIKSKANEIHARPCKLNLSASLEFQEDGSKQIQKIPMTEVIDFVPAVFR